MVKKEGSKNITNEKKFVISYLYNHTQLSIYKIARLLNISNATVNNYKNFNSQSTKYNEIITKTPKETRLSDF